MQNGDALAVLMRDLNVRVINISPAGILVESDRRTSVGTLGRLRIRIGQEDLIDNIAVLRCQPIEGAGIYHVAMRFMLTTARRAQSIRRALAQEIAALENRKMTTPFV